MTGPASAPSRLVAPTGVTVSEAMTLGAVYRAVSILATTASSLSVATRRAGKDIRDHSLILQPSLEMTRRRWIAQNVVSLAVTGEAFWRLQRANADDPVISCDVLTPGAVSVDRDTRDARKLRYGHTDANGERQELADWQIRHLRLLELPGQLRGAGPIQAAQAQLRGALDLRNHVGQWFTGAGVPTGVLKTEAELTSVQADAYRERWDALQATRGTAVLGNGLSYSPILLSPADALWIAGSQMQTADVARLFGIPALMLEIALEGSSLTYTNARDIDALFLRSTLAGYLAPIEDALSDLLPRGTTAQFRSDELLRLDEESLIGVLATAVGSGLMTRGEARSRMGLDPDVIPDTPPSPVPPTDPAPPAPQTPQPPRSDGAAA